MKHINLSVFISLAVCLCLPLSNAKAQEHSHSEHHGASIDFREFNMKRANFIMDSLNIPASDRPGYLKFLKREFVKSKSAGLEKEITPYSDYFPDRSLIRGPFCLNAGFELFDFSNWLPSYGTYASPGATAGVASSVMNATVYDIAARHTILTTPPLNNDPGAGPIVGYDPLAIHPTTGLAEIPLVAPTGSGVSCRLGNANIGAQAEKLIYPIAVTSANTQFYYQFAIVLEDPLGGHTATQQPYFQISVTDASGASVGGVCGIYNVNSSLALTDASFIYSTAGGENVIYRKWELVGIDLSALIGSTVNIEFITADCSLTGHFGYAYIDADCGAIGLQTSYCSSDLFATIVAPPGFDNYQWYGPNSSTLAIPGATNDTLIINPPTLLDTFYVTATSPSGCVSNLSTVLEFTTISLGSSNITNSCYHGTTGSATVYPTGSSSGYTYLWSTGATTQTITGVGPGTYTVHIESAGGFCGIIDTFIVVGANPVFASSVIVPYCNPLYTEIVAPVGSVYNWYTSAGVPIGTNDTVGITSPTDGMQILLGYDLVAGCRDSIVYTLDLTTPPGTFSSSVGPGCSQASVNYTMGASGVTYTITGPAGYNNTSGLTTATNYTLTGLEPGTYTALVDDNGCISVQTFTITLTVSSSTNNVVPCEGDDITLSNSAVGVHSWYDPSGTLITTGGSASIIVTDILEGTYVDSAYTDPACLQINYYVVEYDSITATFSSVQNFCFEDSDGILTAVVTHDPPTTTPVISWTGPSGFTGTGSPQTSLATGAYNWTITSGNCILTGTINVNGPSAPPDTLAILTNVCLGNPSAVLVAPAGFTNYQWYFSGAPVSGANNDSLLITNTDFFLSYSVTYDIPPYGCDRLTSFIINDKPDPVFIPDKIVNIITPNGDGQNDKFYPFIPFVPAKDGNPEYYLSVEELNVVTYSFVITIFDRWGKLVFESSDYLTPWDGKFKGKEVSDGVYFWQLKYVPKCGNENEPIGFSGTVQVSR
jgi:gliding motility-associated-like protein